MLDLDNAFRVVFPQHVRVIKLSSEGASNLAKQVFLEAFLILSFSFLLWTFPAQRMCSSDVSPQSGCPLITYRVNRVALFIHGELCVFFFSKDPRRNFSTLGGTKTKNLYKSYFHCKKNWCYNFFAFFKKNRMYF